MPNADSAQRRLVIRLIRVSSPSPVNRMNARSLARPGLGRYHAGSAHRAPDRSAPCRSSTARRARAAPPPPPSTNVCTAPSPAAAGARSGSAMIRSHLPELASRASVAVGAQQHRHRPEPAERDRERQRARPGAHQHARRARPGGRRSRSARGRRCRSARRPRGRVGAVLEQEEVSSGALRLRSSTSSPSEIRVPGWICSSRASRGSWRPPRARARARRGPCAGACRRAERAIPAPTAAGQLEPVADAVADLRASSASGSSGTRATSAGQLARPRPASAPSAATVGQVTSFAVEPTTSPKCPARSASS